MPDRPTPIKTHNLYLAGWKQNSLTQSVRQRTLPPVIFGLNTTTLTSPVSKQTNMKLKERHL
jgi:hypothetical protein